MSEFIENNPEEKNISLGISIPEDEYEITFSRSSGPGGQKVNKSATKATLRWNLWQSSLSDEQKSQLRERLAKRLTKEGDLILFDQSERSQVRNRENVIQRLNEIIDQALIPEKERIPTRPSRGIKERRLREKKIIGEKKELRKPPEVEY